MVVSTVQMQTISRGTAQVLSVGLKIALNLLKVLTLPLDFGINRRYMMGTPPEME